MKERLEQIQTQFKGVSGSIYLIIDGTHFDYIDVDQDRLEGVRSVTLSCRCCSDYEPFDSELSHELEYMCEDEFQELIEELATIK